MASPLTTIILITLSSFLSVKTYSHTVCLTYELVLVVWYVDTLRWELVPGGVEWRGKSLVLLTELLKSCNDRHQACLLQQDRPCLNMSLTLLEALRQHLRVGFFVFFLYYIYIFFCICHSNSISIIFWLWYDAWDQEEKAWAYTFADSKDL